MNRQWIIASFTILACVAAVTLIGAMEWYQEAAAIAAFTCIGILLYIQARQHRLLYLYSFVTVGGIIALLIHAQMTRRVTVANASGLLVTEATILLDLGDGHEAHLLMHDLQTNTETQVEFRDWDFGGVFYIWGQWTDGRRFSAGPSSSDQFGTAAPRIPGYRSHIYITIRKPNETLDVHF